MKYKDLYIPRNLTLETAQEMNKLHCACTDLSTHIETNFRCPKRNEFGVSSSYVMCRDCIFQAAHHATLEKYVNSKEILAHAL